MPPKILLVDDVNMFLELQKGFLKHSSVTILTAGDGAEALKICRAARPALVFMDLHMPVMDGLECCAAIKTDPVLKSIPVVMITSAGKEEDRARCLKAGCDDFLTKPLDRQLYLELARSFLPDIDRRDKRIDCRAKIKFRAFGVSLSGEVTNLSALGVYIATEYAMETDTIIDLVFALPEENGAIIHCKGRVAWPNSKSDRHKLSLPEGFGVEFIALPGESRVALASFVERHK